MRASGGKEAEIDVHRLERARTGIDGLDMAAGDVAEQRAMGGGRRRQDDRLAEPFRGGKAAGEKANGGGLDIAFAAR